MKLTVALIASLVTGAFASRLTATAPKEIRITEVKADSKFGMDLLSKSRILEDQNGDQQEQDGDTWIAGMALKFQGCHHVVQWNPDAEDGEDGMRVETKRLARFRLCPAGSCSNTFSAGCNTGFGDYIVDLDDFLESYVEAKQEEEEEACETYREYNCECDEDEDKDDQFDPDVCEYQCFQNAGMNECIDYYHDNNNYNNNNNWYNYNNDGEEGEDEEQPDQIDISDYTTCTAYEGVDGYVYYDNGKQDTNSRNSNYWNNNNQEGEQNENGNNNQDQNFDGDYYIGPYCSDDGGGVVLGMFTDEFCTVFADQYGGVRAFKYVSGGQTLPHSSSTDSIVDFNCKSCQEVEEEEGEGQERSRRLEDMNGAEAKEICTNMYEVAVKCEENLFGYDFDQTSSSCSYIKAVKEMGKTGFFSNHQATPHTVASTFIGISSALCVGLGGYVHYLKQKLDRGSIDIH